MKIELYRGRRNGERTPRTGHCCRHREAEVTASRGERLREPHQLAAAATEEPSSCPAQGSSRGWSNHSHMLLHSNPPPCGAAEARTLRITSRMAEKLLQLAPWSTSCRSTRRQLALDPKRPPGYSAQEVAGLLKSMHDWPRASHWMSRRPSLHMPVRLRMLAWHRAV